MYMLIYILLDFINMKWDTHASMPKVNIDNIFDHDKYDILWIWDTLATLPKVVIHDRNK